MCPGIKLGGLLQPRDSTLILPLVHLFSRAYGSGLSTVYKMPLYQGLVTGDLLELSNIQLLLEIDGFLGTVPQRDIPICLPQDLCLNTVGHHISSLQYREAIIDLFFSLMLEP